MMGPHGVHLLCMVAMSWLAPHEQTPERYETCHEVGMAADLTTIPPDLAVALAYTESRFRHDAVSSVGARGPFQIVPRFHCPNRTHEGCDLVAAGLSALKRYRTRYKRWREVLCHWNSGNRCYRRSKAFARIVLRRRRILTRALGD